MDIPPCLLEVPDEWADALGVFTWLYKSGMSGPEPNFTAVESLQIPQGFHIQHQWVLQEIEEVQERRREEERAKRGGTRRM